MEADPFCVQGTRRIKLGDNARKSKATHNALAPPTAILLLFGLPSTFAWTQGTWGPGH